LSKRCIIATQNDLFTCLCIFDMQMTTRTVHNLIFVLLSYISEYFCIAQYC